MRTWRGFRAPQVYSPSTRACAHARPWFLCCILYCAFPPRDARHNTRSLAEFWQIYGAKKGKTASSGNAENAISVNVYGGLALVDNFLKYKLNRGRILADWASQKPPKGRFAPLAWLNDVCLGFCFLDGGRAP